MDEKWNAKPLPAMDSLTVDRDHYYRQVLHGFYDLPCMLANGGQRSAYLYVPESSAYNQPVIYILAPKGGNPGCFLEKSGWKDKSDAAGLYLVVLTPEDQAWDPAPQEMPYLAAVLKRVLNRPLFSSLPFKYYGAGYGEGSKILAYHALHNPQIWSGILLAGLGGMDEGTAQELSSTQSAEPNVFLNQVQMPVWMVEAEKNEDTARMVQYFCQANHAQRQGEDKTIRGIRLTYTQYTPEAGGTVDEDWCAKVMVTYAHWRDCLNLEFAGTVFDELFSGTCRYPGNRVGALRYDGDIYTRGFQKFTGKVPGGYRDDPSDYYCREWYVYRPEKEGPLPVVFLFHARGGSGNEIGDRSGWARLAREEGILLVCPTASNENTVRFMRGLSTNFLFCSRWNTAKAKPECPNDMIFLDYLYQWVKEDYPVDPSRIYACGQSSGGTMAWSCAAYRPDYFAAVAPVSAKSVNKVDEPLPFTEGSLVPIFASMGTEDQTFPGGFATDDARELVDYWSHRGGLDRQWTDFTFMKGGESCTFKEGLASNYIFRNRQNVPMLRLIEMDTKTHAIWPSESRMIWNEWFTKFRKDPDTKTLYYNGDPVDDPRRV